VGFIMIVASYTLRVTAAGPDVARVAVRRQQFTVGRPIEFDESSPRIAALEYALGALAGEVVNGLRVFASRRRIEVDRIEAVVTGELERGLAYLEVVGEGVQPRIARVHLQVFAASPDEPGLRRLWGELPDRLPLVCTMRSAFPIDLTLTMTP
jgi:hypothetical protein